MTAGGQVQRHLICHILTLLSQLPRVSPSWHASTRVGLPCPISAYLLSDLRLLFKEVPSTVSLQIDDTWNLTVAKTVGSARYFDFVHMHTHLTKVYVVQIAPRLRERPPSRPSHRGLSHHRHRPRMAA